MQRLTIAEAAKQLDVSQEAVRQRVRRGTLEHEKDEEGKTYVFLNEPTETDDHTNVLENPVVKGYINALRSQIEGLESDRDEWRDEARRKDHIIMSLTQRIPAIEAPVAESTDTSDARESAVTASDEQSKGAVPQESAEGEIRKPWWQRLFGG